MSNPDLIRIKACPVCGKFPHYDIYAMKLEHICKTPEQSFCAYGGQPLTVPRWNDRCELIAEKLGKEAGQA